MKHIGILAMALLFTVSAFSISLAQAPAPPDPADKAAQDRYNKQKEANPEGYKSTLPAPPKPIVAGQPAPPAYPKFISYPTSHQKPVLISSGNPESDKALYDLRLQHWTFIFDQKAYVSKYGALPGNLPGGVSAEAYAKNPPAKAFSADLERKMAELEAAGQKQ